MATELARIAGVADARDAIRESVALPVPGLTDVGPSAARVVACINVE